MSSHGGSRWQIGVPDFVSPSYFPAIAAVELGFMREEGVNAEITLQFPVTDAAHALRAGRLDFLAGAAHAPLYAYPGWQGVKLLTALSQNMYWFLVVRSDLGIERGDLASLRNLRVGAAPGVGDGLAQLLLRSGVDVESAGIVIAPVPGAGPGSISFGVAAAEALADGRVDAFWANGMGAEVAVTRGTGTIVVDARRDSGPGTTLTFPALSASEEFIAREPGAVEGAVRACVRAQQALQRDPDLAGTIGKRIYPSYEASLTARLIRRDAPFFEPSIGESSVNGLNDFAHSIGLDPGRGAFEDVVATAFMGCWASSRADGMGT